MSKKILQVLATHQVAQMYINHHAYRDELVNEVNAWMRKMINKHDPAGVFEVGCMLSVASMHVSNVVGNLRYGHVFSLIFEDAEAPREEWKHEEIFLRVSEVGQIVEICPIWPTVH